MISLRGIYLQRKKQLLGWLLPKLHKLVARVEAHHRSAAANLMDAATLPGARWAICQRCPALNKQLNVCQKCGCFMPAKVQITGAKCPDKNW